MFFPAAVLMGLMMNMFYQTFSAIFLLLALLAGDCLADAERSRIKESRRQLSVVPKGAPMHSVAGMAGPADSKKVYETKRQEVWYYPGGEVFFSEGKVKRVRLETSSRYAAMTLKGATKGTDQAKGVVSIRKEPPSMNPHKVAKVFTEIIRDIPSEEGPATGSSLTPSRAAGGPAHQPLGGRFQPAPEPLVARDEFENDEAE